MGLTPKSIERCFILICYLFILGGCASKAQPPFPPAAPDIVEGAIVTAKGDPADMDRFLALASEADYILIGEAHSSGCDHVMQSRFLEALAQAQGRFPVGLEMISNDFQASLDAVNAGDVPLESFPESVNWPETWGYDYDLYKPVFEAAYAYSLPLYGLNVPRGIVKKVSRGGVESLTEAERTRWIPQTIIPPSEAQRDSLMEMLEAHRSMMDKGQSVEDVDTEVQVPEKMVPEKQASEGRKSKEQSDKGQSEKDQNNNDKSQSTTRRHSKEQISATGKPDATKGMTGRMDRFFLVQSLWDTAMAERAVQVRKTHGSPVVVLAGSGHVEFGWGLAHRLTALDEGARVLLIAPWRAMEQPDPLEADLRFYCPVTHKSRMGFTLTMAQNGAKIVRVAPDSPAEKAGFIAGDSIVTIMDDAVESMWVMHKAAVKASKQGEPLRFGILRDGEELMLSMPVEPDTADDSTSDAPMSTESE